MKKLFSFVAFSDKLLEVVQSLLDVKNKVQWTWDSPVKETGLAPEKKNVLHMWNNNDLLKFSLLLIKHS
jgi:hypothetical protein